eukprot:gene14888-biopygen6625
MNGGIIPPNTLYVLAHLPALTLLTGWENPYPAVESGGAGGPGKRDAVAVHRAGSRLPAPAKGKGKGQARVHLWGCYFPHHTPGGV